MHARIATFEIPTGMPREAGEQVIAEIRKRIDAEGGPEGAQRVVILADRDAGKVHNVTFFESAEHMAAAEEFFEQMTPVRPPDGSDPGRRTDVGHFEVMLDHTL